MKYRTNISICKQRLLYTCRVTIQESADEPAIDFLLSLQNQRCAYFQLPDHYCSICRCTCNKVLDYYYRWDCCKFPDRIAVSAVSAVAQATMKTIIIVESVNEIIILESANAATNCLIICCRLGICARKEWNCLIIIAESIDGPAIYMAAQYYRSCRPAK